MSQAFDKLDITKFDVSRDRGFLCKYDPATVEMPADLQPLVDAGRMLPEWMATGVVRHYLKNIPEIDVSSFIDSASDAQLRNAMVHYSFIVQAWVWGEKEPNHIIPRNIAVPLCLVADRLGQFPLLPYSAYVLDNFSMFDKSGEPILENIYMHQHFSAGIDESWFKMIHVEIEMEAGQALAAIPEVLEGCDTGNEQQVIDGLKDILAAWHEMYDTMKRMIDYCDPYTYFTRVRPYIHGWQDNPDLPGGVIYEGVEKFKGEIQAFRGQTGSQSSIVPTMDALFGVAHSNDPLRQYLNELHAYRPVLHRKFIEAVAERSTLREFVSKSGNVEMTELYNGCLDRVRAFRALHLEYAAAYINKQNSHAGNPSDVGTGGTPFMKYLKKHRDESERHLLPVPGKKSA